MGRKLASGGFGTVRPAAGAAACAEACAAACAEDGSHAGATFSGTWPSVAGCVVACRLGALQCSSILGFAHQHAGCKRPGVRHRLLLAVQVYRAVLNDPDGVEEPRDVLVKKATEFGEAEVCLGRMRSSGWVPAAHGEAERCSRDLVAVEAAWKLWLFASCVWRGNVMARRCVGAEGSGRQVGGEGLMATASRVQSIPGCCLLTNDAAVTSRCRSG